MCLGSEFVPIFCPDGSQLETFVTLFDSKRDLLRLQLAHQQEPLEPFVVHVFAPYWFDNRTGFPLVYGQKWTASNVTLRGGQADDGGGVTLKEMTPDPARLADVLGGKDRPPDVFSFGNKVDLGGAKACVRLGLPFQRYSSKENKMVHCDWSQPFSIDAIGSTCAIDLVADGFSCEVAVQVVLIHTHI